MENEKSEKVVRKRQEVSASDMEKKPYISLKIGETAVIVIDKIEKVDVDKEYALSSADYRYEILCSDGKTLSIGAWKLWGAIREALSGVSDFKGVKLRVSHIDREVYTAELVG